MEILQELKTKLQNLLDVKGAELELVLPDAIDLIDDIETAVDALEDAETKLEERIRELESEVGELEDEEPAGSAICDINTGRDTIYVRADGGNLLDTQIIEAFKDAMESDKVKPTFLLEMLQGLTK
ncbi:MAG: hypothetical protein FD166_3583 [Bacteroidetes bacterium]|nr:MAG: hypothetical protein FD166_3583 [Bacteroidota bacterium]